MDFLFQDDGPEIILRELMRPHAVMVQDVFEPDMSDSYIKLALTCFGDIVGDGVPGGDCQKQPGGGIMTAPNYSSPTALQYRGNFERLDRDNSENEGGDNSEIVDCLVEQNEESERDAAAEDIADDIRARHNEQQNPNNVEMGAFILRIPDGNGGFRTVRVQTPSLGTTGAVSLDGMYAQAQREFPGIDASNIVGAVHLHPSGPVGSPPVFDTDGNLSDIDFGNLMPSHPNLMVSPRNDWEGLERFVQANGRSDTTGLSHYILGPDGVLREYDYADGHPAEVGQIQEGIDSAKDDAEGACS